MSHTSANGRDALSGRAAEAAPGAEISSVVIAAGVAPPGEPVAMWVSAGDYASPCFLSRNFAESLWRTCSFSAVPPQMRMTAAQRPKGGAAAPRSCTATRTTTQSRGRGGRSEDARPTATLYDLDQLGRAAAVRLAAARISRRSLEHRSPHRKCQAERLKLPQRAS